MDSPPPENAENDTPKRWKFRDDILPWFWRKPVITDEDGLIPRADGDQPPVPARALWPAVAVAVLVIGVLGGLFALLRRDPPAGTASGRAPAPPTATLPETVEPERRQRAWKTIKGFLEATSVEEKLPFVAWPEKVESKMRDYYGRFPDEAPSLRGFQFLSSRPTFATVNDYSLAITVDEAAANTVLYVLLAEGDRLGIDWECLVAYCPLSLADFVASPPAAPVAMRVTAVPSDYYNYGFLDSDRFQAYELRVQAEAKTTLHAYARRDSECHADIAAAVRDARPVPLTLLLAPPAVPGQPFCEIESVLRADWSGE